MQFDMNLAGKILAALENRSPADVNKPFEIEGYSHEEISYHVKSLKADGYIEAIDFSHMQGFSWKPVSMTLKGHELLDEIRKKAQESKPKRPIGF